MTDRAFYGRAGREGNSSKLRVKTNSIRRAEEEIDAEIREYLNSFTVDRPDTSSPTNPRDLNDYGTK